MSESDAAVDRGDNAEKEECPLCLEPLPPFWDRERRKLLICCGGAVCVDCSKKQHAYLSSAAGSGSFGREEEQLQRCCPLCRALKPVLGTIGTFMKDRFDKGLLPLNMYGDLGVHFIEGRGGVERNVERGIEILKLGAEKGDPTCQYGIGSRYYEGTYGLPKSITEAKRLWLAATEQGHAMAECNLAVIMRDEGNDTEYLRYLRSSAAKGYDDACYFIGRAYYRGDHGLQKSMEQAIREVTPAAERGHAESMAILGYVMCNPDPWVPPVDNPCFVRGVHWLRRAAEAGDDTAIAELRKLEEYASTKCFGGMCYKKAPPEIKFLRCSRCRAAWYCSKDCQRRHWKAGVWGHKQFCIKWEDKKEDREKES